MARGDRQVRSGSSRSHLQIGSGPCRPAPLLSFARQPTSGVVPICELPPDGHSLLELSSRTWRSAPAIEHDPRWSNRRALGRLHADARASGCPRALAAVGEAGRAPGRTVSFCCPGILPGSAARIRHRTVGRTLGVRSATRQESAGSDAWPARTETRSRGHRGSCRRNGRRRQRQHGDEPRCSRATTHRTSWHHPAITPGVLAGSDARARRSFGRISPVFGPRLHTSGHCKGSRPRLIQLIF